MSTSVYYSGILLRPIHTGAPLVFNTIDERAGRALSVSMTSGDRPGPLSDLVTHAMGPLSYDMGQMDALIHYLKTELPEVIGKQVDEQLSAQVGAMAEKLTAANLQQHTELKADLNGAKEAMLAKKSNSVVTLNGSILSVGKITEAFSKTAELLQSVGKAIKGLANADSNVDGVSFPRQLGRSLLGGARGTLKISAAGLGAAAVMATVLATSGIALNKAHEHFPTAPSATMVVSSIVGQAQNLKVAVGAFEVEKAGGADVKTLSVQERATALLAQNKGDHAKAIEQVNNALAQSYLGEANVDAIAKQRQLLSTLQGMQPQAPVAGVSTGPSGP